ncbi:hypothetical protein acdb102_24650 [Acidothermaceae bacterium B102]|nr:hypothetical protein acdb102_24650 [Acidothermaceae bacterium B102]
MLSIRALPLLTGYVLLPQARAVIKLDVARWQRVNRRPDNGVLGLLELLTDTTHEFRNLYNHRVSRCGLIGQILSRALATVYHAEHTLFLWTEDIGPGLFIDHGFSTVVSAERVGANCWIGSQVTIGYDSGREAPVIEDDVVVDSGAIVLGGITLGRGSHAGAGSVVVKDVPAGLFAVGVPAHNREPLRHRGERPRQRV